MDFLGKTSKNPKQYYYIVSNGKIKYYTSRNNKIISKQDIPKEIISKIEKKDIGKVENLKNLQEYEKILKLNCYYIKNLYKNFKIIETSWYEQVKKIF